MSSRTSGRARDPRAGAPDERATRERFAQRATDARRQVRRRRLLAALAVVVVGALVWLLGFSSLLAVGDVEVTGAADPDVAAVEDVALEESGTPLARVDTDELADRLREQVPGVAHADVSRGWPQTLTVEITPREPALAVTSEDGTIGLMDLEGVTFRSVDSVPDGVPEVTAEEGAEVTSDGVAAAREMLAALPDGLRGRVDDIRVDEADQVSFAVGETRVVWGDKSESERKVELVQVLLEEEPATIDVSAPDTPVTRDGETSAEPQG